MVIDKRQSLSNHHAAEKRKPGSLKKCKQCDLFQQYGLHFALHPPFYAAKAASKTECRHVWLPIQYLFQKTQYACQILCGLFLGAVSGMAAFRRGVEPGFFVLEVVQFGVEL